MILNVNVTIVVKCVGWRGVGGGGEGGGWQEICESTSKEYSRDFVRKHPSETP